MSVNYSSTFQNIASRVNSIGNANTINALSNRIGYVGEEEPDKLDTQLKDLEARVSTLEHEAIGKFITLSDHARRLSECSIEEIAEIGRQMIAYYYDDSPGGFKKIIELGGGPGGGRKPNVPTANANANVTIIVPEISPKGVSYSAYVDELRQHASGICGSSVDAINLSQDYLRSEYHDTFIIVTKPFKMPNTSMFKANTILFPSSGGNSNVSIVFSSPFIGDITHNVIDAFKPHNVTDAFTPHKVIDAFKSP